MGKTRTQSQTQIDRRLARCLPLTAGTFLLASSQTCQAHNGAPLPVVHPVLSHPTSHLTTPSRLLPAALTTSAFGKSSLPASSTSYDLDLASTTQNVMLGSKMFDGAASVNITLGGSTATFRPGQTVTAAEFVAIQQVLSGSPQTLVLSASGVATGGTFSLNQEGSLKISELLIPQGVTGLDNLSSSKALTISGSLINDGFLYGIAGRGSSSPITIHAAAITNDGLISTDLAGSGLSAQALAGAGKSSGLDLFSGQDLSNSGTITSVGTMALSIGSGNLSNSGTVQSEKGSINISTSNPSTDLNITATGGTFSSANGSINVRDASYNGSANIVMAGGNFLSRDLNLYGGAGTITGEVGQVSGRLNTTGEAAHFWASTQTLTLGSNDIKGDPTYVNTTGSIVINGAVVAAEDITILAAGSITAKGDAYISTANSTGTSGSTAPSTDVTLMAGATITPGSLTETATVPGSAIASGAQASVMPAAAGIGGNIDFSKSTYTGPIINTSSSLPGTGAQNPNGGNVTLIATGSGTAKTPTGQILFPTKGTSIDASSVYGTGGTVLIATSVENSGVTGISIGNVYAYTNPFLGQKDGSITLTDGFASTTGGMPLVYNSQGQLIMGSYQITGTGLATFVLNGTVNAGTGIGGGAAVIVSTSGPIVQPTANKGYIEGGNVGLIAFNIGSPTASVQTIANQSLTIFASGNTYINNIGPVNLISTQGQATSILQLTTTPNAAGNGQIVVDPPNTSPAMQYSTITLISSEANGGTGGIVFTASGDNMQANTINLSDGKGGTGTGAIIVANNIFIATNLSCNTSGTVSVAATGPVNLLSSSAGAGQDFSLATSPNTAGSGNITVLGTVAAAAKTGTIGSIFLQSSETTGTGGIVTGKKGFLSATNISLADGPTGMGFGAIGTSAASPVVLSTTNLTCGTDNNQFIKDTYTGSVVLQTASAAPTGHGTFSLVSDGSIDAAGGIDAGSAIILTAGGKAGSITVGQSMSTNDPNSTITLSASGTGAINDNTNVLGTDMVVAPNGNVVLNSPSGGIGSTSSPFQIQAASLVSNATGSTYIYNYTSNPLTLAATDCKNQFTLLTQGGLTINAPITSATGINITETGTGTGSITYGANLGSASKTGNVSISISGNFNVESSSPTAVISASGVVDITTEGTIGQLGGSLQIASATVSLNALGNTGDGVAANIVGTSGAKTATISNSGAQGDFLVTGKVSLTASNIQTVDGTILVQTSGSLLQTAAGSSIQIGSSTDRGASADSVVLNDTSKSGSIILGADSSISTYTNTAGGISILIAIPGTPQSGTKPAAIMATATGTGAIFYGAKGIVAEGPANNINVTAIDTNVVFDTNGQPASHITVQPGVVIYADPPAGGAAQASAQPLSALALTQAAAASVNQSPQTGNQAKSGGESLPATFAMPSAGTTYGVPTSSLSDALSFSTETAGSVSAGTITEAGLSSLNALTATAAGTAALRTALPSSMFAALQSPRGMVPALLVSDVDLGITSDTAAIVDLEAEEAALDARETKVDRAQVSLPLSGRITNSKVLKLSQGAMLFSPARETEIKTKSANLKIAAESVVLIISLHDGVAVYDLHDRQKGAVEISTHGKTLSLYPGRFALLSAAPGKSFGELNPTLAIGYRNIERQRLTPHLEAYTADYCLSHAMQTVEPLNKILLSQNPRCKSFANRLLKTAAILSQLTGDGNFQQVMPPMKTACLK